MRSHRDRRGWGEGRVRGRRGWGEGGSIKAHSIINYSHISGTGEADASFKRSEIW